MQLKDTLARFLTLDGVTLAAVVGTDGLMIDSAEKGEFDADAVSAAAPSLLSAAQTLAAEVTQGRLVQAMAEFENGTMIMEPLGESGVLLVITESVGSIGRVRLVARREREALEQALAL